MAKMTFTQNEHGFYVCNAQVNSDFNLHVELEQEGTIVLDMSTVSGGEYETKWGARVGLVVDKDFRAGVYPKYLRITSRTKPKTNCYITEAE